MSKKILCLFDVDGTLTKSRNTIQPHVEDYLYSKLRPKCTLGIVGGSDLNKIQEQMNGDTFLDKFTHVFAENGLVYLKNGVEVARESIQNKLGEDSLQTVINHTLKLLSDITLPVKRGTFIEFRAGMLNVCPIGRSCSQQERDAFERYDNEHKVRENMIVALKREFPEVGLTYSIGGQISFDVFPTGWDKRYCLGHLEKEQFDVIHFFGDKTFHGGNDHEIFNDERTVGHTVKNPEDTLKQLDELLKSL